MTDTLITDDFADDSEDGAWYTPVAWIAYSLQAPLVKANRAKDYAEQGDELIRGGLMAHTDRLQAEHNVNVEIHGDDAPVAMPLDYLAVMATRTVDARLKETNELLRGLLTVATKELISVENLREDGKLFVPQSDIDEVAEMIQPQVDFNALFEKLFNEDGTLDISAIFGDDLVEDEVEDEAVPEDVVPEDNDS